MYDREGRRNMEDRINMEGKRNMEGMRNMEGRRNMEDMRNMEGKRNIITNTATSNIIIYNTINFTPD